MTQTAVRPELDLKAIASRLEETAIDARAQVQVLDQRVVTGHDLTDSDEKLKLNMLQIASDCRDALHRIELGTYGLCLQCDEAIDEERLRNYPYAALCLSCKKSNAGPVSSLVTQARDAIAQQSQPISGEGASTGNGEVGGSAGTPVVNTEAAPSSEPLPRAQCPVCLRVVPVRRGGELREHTPTSAGTAKCPNSGKLAPSSTETSTPAAVTTEPSGSPPQQKPAKPAGAEVSKQFGDLVIPGANRGGHVDSLPVAQIKPSTKNPRSDVGDVSELAASIGSIGLLQPLVVVKNGQGFSLIAGHRRLAAVKQLEWKEVPVVVFNLSEKEQLEAMLIENIQRSDITALEEANAYQQLIDVHGMSQRELADRIGRSQSHISKRVSLLDLPEKAVELIDSGGITQDQAQTFLKLKDHPKRMDAAVKEFASKGSNYYTVDRIVGEQMAVVKREQKLTKLRQKIKDEKLPVISDKAWTNLDYNNKADLGPGYGSLDVDPKEHELEECHRLRLVNLSHGTPRLVKVCVDISRHKKSGKSKLKGSVGGGAGQQRLAGVDKERATAMKRRAELQKVGKTRKEFARALLTKKVSKDDAIEAMALAASLAQPNEMPDAGALCDALGVKVSSNAWQRDEAGLTEGDRKLRALIESDPECKTKLVMAMALHVLESEASFAGDNFGDESGSSWLNVTGYLAFLERKGYTITELELEEIASAAKRRDEIRAAAAEAKKSTKKKGAAA